MLLRVVLGASQVTFETNGKAIGSVGGEGRE